MPDNNNSHADSNRNPGLSPKRTAIFQEIVQAFWNGEIADNRDLEVLSVKIKDKYGFAHDQESFVHDQIRIAMGLDPTGKADFTDEVLRVQSMNESALPVVVKLEEVCRRCSEEKKPCQDACKYDAFIYSRSQGLKLHDEKCLNCGDCVAKCDLGALNDKIEFIPLVKLLKDPGTSVYAAVAPAIAGQFGDSISMGQLRTAFKLLGFADMIEVALFADILTIGEAYEFNDLVQSENDFYLTSCCCPVWFNLVKKTYPDLFEHMSPSISPMIASGRFLKALYPKSKVVFISPCIAKKAESKEPELEGAIDFVLTFSELKTVWDVLGIQLQDLHSEEKDQASFGGRIYARTGGVSFSVKSVVNRIAPHRLVKLTAKKVDGVVSCRNLLQSLSEVNNTEANFIEGMGCNGGCVGGPKTIVDKDQALELVNEFAEESYIMTPLDNLNVLKILSELGVERFEDIVENHIIHNLLTRNKIPGD